MNELEEADKMRILPPETPPEENPIPAAIYAAQAAGSVASKGATAAASAAEDTVQAGVPVLKEGWDVIKSTGKSIMGNPEDDFYSGVVDPAFRPNPPEGEKMLEIKEEVSQPQKSEPSPPAVANPPLEVVNPPKKWTRTQQKRLEAVLDHYNIGSLFGGDPGVGPIAQKIISEHPKWKGSTILRAVKKAIKGGALTIKAPATNPPAKEEPKAAIQPPAEKPAAANPPAAAPAAKVVEAVLNPPVPSAIVNPPTPTGIANPCKHVALMFVGRANPVKGGQQIKVFKCVECGKHFKR
jgi:hypothetical protein